MVQSPVTFLGWFIGESKGGVTLSLNTIVEHLSNLLLYYRVHVDCLHMKDGNILTGIIEKVEKKLRIFASPGVGQVIKILNFQVHRCELN